MLLLLTPVKVNSGIARDAFTQKSRALLPSHTHTPPPLSSSSPHLPSSTHPPTHPPNHPPNHPPTHPTNQPTYLPTNLPTPTHPHTHTPTNPPTHTPPPPPPPSPPTPPLTTTTTTSRFSHRLPCGPRTRHSDWQWHREKRSSQVHLVVVHVGVWSASKVKRGCEDPYRCAQIQGRRTHHEVNWSSILSVDR